MTQNQIRYLEAQETARANRARENENYRSNKAKEKENIRSNQAKELETKRSNLINESLNTAKLDYDKYGSGLVSSIIRTIKAEAQEGDLTNAMKTGLARELNNLSELTGIAVSGDKSSTSNKKLNTTGSPKPALLSDDQLREMSADEIRAYWVENKDTLTDDQKERLKKWYQSKTVAESKDKIGNKMKGWFKL